MTLESLMPKLSLKQKITLGIGALATLFSSLTPNIALAEELKDKGWLIPPPQIIKREIGNAICDCRDDFPGYESYVVIYATNFSKLPHDYKDEHKIGFSLNGLHFFAAVHMIDKYNYTLGDNWAYLLNTTGKLVDASDKLAFQLVLVKDGMLPWPDSQFHKKLYFSELKDVKFSNIKLDPGFPNTLY